MNEDQAKGNLKQMSGSLKEKWGKLTDNEITESKGKKDYLIGKVQEHYGKSKEEAKEEVNAFFDAYELKNESQSPNQTI